MLTACHGKIQCNDRPRLTATLHNPESHPIAVVLIANSLGALRHFTARFSGHLADTGFFAPTLDDRGSSDSPDPNSGAKGFDPAMGKTRHENGPVEPPGEVLEQSGKNQGAMEQSG